MAETREVVVPDIGDFTDVPIIEVMVGPGDSVQPEDPIVTLESDKATMDVPAPFGGVVQELRVDVGDKVSEGTPLMLLALEADGGQPSAAAAAPQPAPQPAASPAEAGAPGAVDSAVEAETEADEAASPPARRQPAPAGAGEAPAAAGAPPAAGGPAEAPEQPAAPAARDGAPPYASPSARRLARELGIDLAGLQGTGRKGRITKEDIQAAKDGAAAPAAAEAEAAAPAGAAQGPALAGLPPWPSLDFEKFGPVERVELSRIKRISGPNLARNWVMIPHVTHHDEADITDLEAFRKETNERLAKQGVKLTMVALLIRACLASLKEFPELNASLDGDHLILKRFYNIGFAADTPQGLVVPVIKNADQKGIVDIASELAELSGAAREGKLKIADMQGASFTISSLGGIGGTAFTPIVNAPEVAILGVARSAMKPVWDGREFRPRLVVPLSLSYDHRVVDGALAARFTAHLASVLTDLRRALL
jgi:pyruvate dehydrogenase E2 component (dihydrolipoamide acetyltransferase)